VNGIEKSARARVLDPESKVLIPEYLSCKSLRLNILPALAPTSTKQLIKNEYLTNNNTKKMRGLIDYGKTLSPHADARNENTAPAL
jgi:hypothetical protein